MPHLSLFLSLSLSLTHTLTLTHIFLAAQFHIGHLYYLQGQCSQAREVFEGILATKSVPNSIRAMTLRQLGKIRGCIGSYLCQIATKSNYCSYCR